MVSVGYEGLINRVVILTGGGPRTFQCSMLYWNHCKGGGGTDVKALVLGTHPRPYLLTKLIYVKIHAYKHLELQSFNTQGH